MAYVLSLPPQQPFRRSISDLRYERSCSAASFSSSTNVIRQQREPNNFSSASLETCPSVEAASFPWHKENIQLGASPPRSSPFSGTRSNRTSRQRSRSALHTSPHVTEHPLTSEEGPRDSVIDVDVEEDEIVQTRHGLTTLAIGHGLPDIGYEPPTDDAGHGTGADTASSASLKLEIADGGNLRPPGSVQAENAADNLPFKRWVSTLRRRNMQRKHGLKQRTERWSLDDMTSDFQPPSIRKERSHHRKSASWSSSLGFITAVKTASVTIASQSIGPLRRSRLRGNGSDVGVSIDSENKTLSPIIDEATWLRSLQRRKILEELVSTEESYLADMKAFVNVYLTLLASMPTVSPSIRTSVEQTVTQIVELHDKLLGELYKVVPEADVTRQDLSQLSSASRRKKHFRWHSADVTVPRHDALVTARRLRHSFEVNRTKEQKVPTITADTNTVAKVAKVFNKLIRQFLVYEAWAAQSESMHKDVLSTYKTVPTLLAFERGLEALAVVEGSINGRGTSGGKGMTLPDLLIKPIQRVCKYPLIFEALCRQTPACDDPVAHDEIQKVLIRIREMTDEVNKATDNPRTRQLVEITWTLQDRICFHDVDHNGLSTSVIFHVLGHVLVCGVLHAAFETVERVKDQYVICVLYRSRLLLATMTRVPQVYNVIAVIPLANATLDEPNNSRGMQCQNAPHTWKLTFVSQHRLFEVVLTACSAKEEEGWKLQMQARIAAENQDLCEGRSTLLDLFSFVPLDLKPLGPVFGQPLSLARRISIRRSQTLGAKAQLRQLVIKNTQAVRSSTDRDNYAHNSNPVVRSQSHLSTAGHITTLSPRRSDRIRLENALSDVWTRDIIPYPGLGYRRSDSSFRASANSVMRKLSMASIASNFSKRSVSYVSVSNSSTATCSADDIFKTSNQMRNVQSVPELGLKPMDQKSRSTLDKRRGTASSGTLSHTQRVVDFHTAPTAFLPEDFELRQLHGRGKKEQSGGSVKELKRRFGDYGRELRTMTPIPATGRSSRAEEHNLTLQEALARPSMMAGRVDDRAMHGVTTHTRTDDRRDKQMAMHEHGRMVLSKSPKAVPPVRAQPPAEHRVTAERHNPVVGERISKTKTRLFKFWS